MPRKKVLALPCSDETLKSPEVLSTWAVVPDMARRIEQAGKGYAQLQGRVLERAENGYQGE